MKAFDAAVAAIVRRAPMGDAQLAKGFQVARRSKLSAVIGGQSQSQTLPKRIERQTLSMAWDATR